VVIVGSRSDAARRPRHDRLAETAGAPLSAAASGAGAVDAWPGMTLLVPDDHPPGLLLKGRILTKADWPVVVAARVDESMSCGWSRAMSMRMRRPAGLRGLWQAR